MRAVCSDFLVKHDFFRVEEEKLCPNRMIVRDWCEIYTNAQFFRKRNRVNSSRRAIGEQPYSVQECLSILFYILLFRHRQQFICIGAVKPLDLNVTLPAKVPKLKDLPTAAQVIHMIRGTDIELPCMLALWLSLRMSEVRGLQFGDYKDGVLTIRRSKLYIGGDDVVREVNKTYNSTRRLVVPEYVGKLIEAVPHESEEDFIVPVNYQIIRKHLRKLAKENGYTLTFHDLRHLNASIMLMLGIPDKYAMERGGWSTTDTLKAVYQHTFSDERKHVDELIDGFFDDILRG